MKESIWKWLSVSSVLLGLFTMSPAPIKDPASARHEIGQHSAEQRLRDLRMNGTMAALGAAPAKTNADGTGVDPVQGDSTAKMALSTAPLASDRNAVQALAEAGKQIDQAKQESHGPWLTALVALLVGFGLFQALRIWMERAGPKPQPRGARYQAAKAALVLEDETWR